MRYVVGFVVFLLALGALRIVGCGGEGEGPECMIQADCDDQNECTVDLCKEGTCSNAPIVPSGHAWPCDFDGIPSITDIEDGICVEDVCVKSPCDDGNECTADFGPHLEDGSCVNDPYTISGPCDWNGEPGVCIEGVCVEDVCLSLVCDDGDPCTDDFCDSLHVVGCLTWPKSCSDRNECTIGSCEPETGQCIQEPVSDGVGCCLRGGLCPGICLGGDCDYCCYEDGECKNGQCF